MEGYLAEVRYFAGTFAPSTWMFCNGAMLAISNYEALFVLIGNTYGGDGINTFALPDLRGRVAIGTGQGPGLSPRTLGQQIGTQTETLVFTQIPAHTHGTDLPLNGLTLKVDGSDATHTDPVAGDYVAKLNETGITYLGYSNTVPDTEMALGSVETSGLTTSGGMAGGSQPHENMQPLLALNYIICVEGIFPSRN